MTKNESSHWMLTDMESVVPQAARGRDSRIDAWQIMDYETDSFSGTLAMASPNARVPPLRIPLPLTGCYDLYLGMHINMCDGLRLKLDADRCFDRLRYDSAASEGHQGFQEVRWRTVELDGRETLTLAMEPDTRISVGYVAARRAGPPRAAHPSRYLVHVTDDGDLMLRGEPGDVADATWQVEHAARQGVNILSLDIDGRTVNRLSYAYPQVRQAFTDLLAEVVRLGANGVNNLDGVHHNKYNFGWNL